MYALIAAIPIFLTVILMVGFNWPAKRALPASWLIACLVLCQDLVQVKMRFSSS